MGTLIAFSGFQAPGSPAYDDVTTTMAPMFVAGCDDAAWMDFDLDGDLVRTSKVLSTPMR